MGAVLSIMGALVLGPLYYAVLIAAVLYVCRGRLEGWLASFITGTAYPDLLMATDVHLALSNGS